MANVLHVNQSEFEALLKEPGKIFVDFYANWCGPCKMLAPSVEKLAEEHPEVKVVKIDVDQDQAVALAYQVQSIPTLITFENGQPVNRKMGFMPYEELENMIK